MKLNHEKQRAYFLSSTIKQYIYYYGVNQTIYALFNRSECLCFHTTNCFKKDINTKIYQTTLEHLYIFLITQFYSDIDFFLIKTIEKRNIYKIPSIDLANTLDISLSKYKSIETGETKLTQNQRKALSLKLNIKSYNQYDYFKNNFKLIN